MFEVRKRALIAQAILSQIRDPSSPVPCSNSGK